MSQRRSPGDGTLFKRGDGLWVGGVELPMGPDGKRRFKRVSSKNRNAALEKLRKLQLEVAAGNVPTASTTTVGKWLEFWQSDILPNRRTKAGLIKPSTIEGYEIAIRLYINPYLGTKRLDRLQPADIRAMYAAVTETVSTRAAQKADQVLRLVIPAAIREGLITANVMDRVDKPYHAKQEGVAFDAATAIHIIDTAVRTQGTMWGARWAAGFLTGARECELLGLEWDRVDFDRGLIDIRWQLQRMKKLHGCGPPVNGIYPCNMNKSAYCPKAKWKFPRAEFRECAGTLCWTPPKTKAGRRLIPLIPALADVLRAIEHDSPNPHGLVFHHPDGKPIDQEQDQKAWRRLLIDAGVPHVKQHSVRHSTATLLLEAGVDVHIIQQVIGHSEIAMTREYQHVSMELARQAWGALGQLLPPP